MLKRFLILLAAFVVVVALLALAFKSNISKKIEMGKHMAPQPTAVSTIVVKSQVWQPVLNSVGSLRAVNGVMLSTDLAGIISKITFESGVPVKKGELLVELDSQQESAQLQSAEAKLEFARLDLARKRDLIEKKAIASSDLDTSQTQLKQAEAAVLEAKALIGRKRIEAPFDGVIGIRQVSLGQYLNPGAMIAPLQSADPIYVEFSLPQQHLEAMQIGRKLRVNATGAEACEGEITAIDSKVDESTRNIMVQGTLPNADHKLRPGMFVNVEVLLPEQGAVLAIPSSAISYATFGDSVFVVQDGKDPAGKPQKIVEQVAVKLGTTRGDQVAIVSGLKGGEEIASGGVFRLQRGAPVQINNDVQPGNELNPKPPES